MLAFSLHAWFVDQTLCVPFFSEVFLPESFHVCSSRVFLHLTCSFPFSQLAHSIFPCWPRHRFDSCPLGPPSGGAFLSTVCGWRRSPFVIHSILQTSCWSFWHNLEHFLSGGSPHSPHLDHLDDAMQLRHWWSLSTSSSKSRSATCGKQWSGPLSLPLKASTLAS